MILMWYLLGTENHVAGYVCAAAVRYLLISSHSLVCANVELLQTFLVINIE